MAGHDLVIEALRDPARIGQWPAARQAALMHQARSAGMMGRLAGLFAGSGAGPVHPALQTAFDAAARVSAAQRAEIARELRYIAQALWGLAAPVVLLKGAAYAAAGLPPAEGRVFGDIDILVPRALLADAEDKLAIAGWRFGDVDPYDERYYRRYSHELPPLTHMHRKTTLDVHHAILPPLARLRPDTPALFEAARALPQAPGFSVLAPADMVLHAMTHLLANDDTSHSLRDLSDLDLLLRHFATAEPGFWDELALRARRHGLRRMLFHGLCQLQALLGTPVPAGSLAELADAAPRGMAAAAMRFVWQGTLGSPHPDAAPRGRALAAALLYLRGHWLRMPLPLLLRHLATKSWMRLRDRDAPPPSEG